MNKKTNNHDYGMYYYVAALVFFRQTSSKEKELTAEPLPRKCFGFPTPRRRKTFLTSGMYKQKTFLPCPRKKVFRYLSGIN